MKKIMTIRGLASQIAIREGKRSQARMGDIREILSILSDIFHETGPGIETIIFANGSARSRRKERKKK